MGGAVKYWTRFSARFATLLTMVSGTLRLLEQNIWPRMRVYTLFGVAVVLLAFLEWKDWRRTRRAGGPQRDEADDADGPPPDAASSFERRWEKELAEARRTAEKVRRDTRSRG